MDDRKKALEQYAKQVSEGNPLADDFVSHLSPEKTDNWNIDRIVANRSLKARNLAEDSLANEVLKNTGVPIPSDTASRSKKEDFLMRLMKERYPELEPNISLDLPTEGDFEGLYRPSSKSIQLANRPSILKNTSGLLHEAGHQYDDKILKYDGPDDVQFKNLKSNSPAHKLITDVDPAEAYEIIAKGHHARIPKLRDADSFGLGALKSMMKSGTFKQAAGAIPLVGGAATALITGEASAGVPVLSEADSVGESASDEIAALKEHDARVNYDKSPAANDRNQQLRTQALQSILKK